jgi:hypothetical protein
VETLASARAATDCGSRLTDLLPVQTPVICFYHDESLPANMQAGALDLLHIARVLVGGDDFLDLGGRNLS